MFVWICARLDARDASTNDLELEAMVRAIAIDQANSVHAADIVKRFPYREVVIFGGCLCVPTVFHKSSHFRSQLLERTLHLQVASCNARYTSCAVSHHTGDYPELLQSHIILILSFQGPKIQRLTRIYSAILVNGTNSINQSLPTQILLESACCPINARTHLVRNTCIILSLSRPKITLNS